jgi:hypothetical protein
MCVEEWKLEYTGYFAGSVAPTGKCHRIDYKASTAVGFIHRPDTLYITINGGYAE